MYIFHSRVGTFSIARNYDGYRLTVNNMDLGTYPSAVAAADDVYMHVTGYWPWDKLDGKADAPSDIYEWEIV